MMEIDNAQELDTVLKKYEKVLVLFYASWCSYCNSFVPVFDKKVVNSGFENVFRVLLDDYDNPLWDDYAIDAVPTVMFFEKGTVSMRLDGRFGAGLSEKQLCVWLSKLKVL